MTTNSTDLPDDADVWRVRYEQTAVEKADLESERDRWQQCALDFAEILKAAGLPVGVVEPLLAEVATVNTTAVIAAEVGRSYRESVQESLAQCREQMKRTSNTADVLGGLLNRLENLTAVSTVRGRQSTKDVHRRLMMRRSTVREVLMGEQVTRQIGA